jgi:hypothetical protein
MSDDEEWAKKLKADLKKKLDDARLKRSRYG